jgi:hypothetical protein
LLQAETGSGNGDVRQRNGRIAAIAAAIFTVLDSTSKVSGNGAGAERGAEAISSWKRAARSDGLR